MTRLVARARQLGRRFGTRRVLASVDLEIAAGEFVAVIGRSGSGKSTLVRILAGLDREIDGDVEVTPRRMVVFQDARLLPWLRVADNVLLGLPRRSAAAARAALDEVGLAGHARAWPRTLSGGEAQRVAFARALVREPELLLLDEPFGALDAFTRLQMHDLVRRIHSSHGQGTLLVTHDVDEALALADRVLVLAGGRVETEVRPADTGHDPRRQLLQALGLG